MSESKKKVLQKVSFYKLFTFADSLDIILMIIGSVGAICNGIARPLSTVVMGQVVDSFGHSDPNNVVHVVSKVSLTLVYLAIFTGISCFLEVTCWMVTGERQSARIRGLYLKTILRQDIAFFDTETSTGEIIGRMSGDTILIQDAMGEKVSKFIELTAAVIGGFVVAFIRGWRLALVLLGFVPVLVIDGAIMSWVMTKMSSYSQIAYADAGNIAEQTVTAIKTVASFTGEKDAIKKYDDKLQVAYKATATQGLASGIGLGVYHFIMASTHALAVWYGAKLIIDKGYSGGQVFNVIIAMLTGGVSLGQTSPCLNAFASGQAAAYKMFESIKRTPKIDASSTEGITKEDITGDIELKEVHFRYPARPDVQIFAGFSLHIPSGTTAALVGQSGSGKSTVISLVERFYDPDSGEVCIDGIDLKKYRLSWIRQKIGLVSQEPVLFTTTLKNNIAYGKDGASDQEIRTAIELANASKFIDKLPQGLDTMVGDRGTQLSGGQKQRIAIARAILKNPQILLLDEATSALDAESERIVQDALDKIMVGRTTVVVAHRLTTIKNADSIAVVHQGNVVEKGNHDELIRNPEGAYSQLVQLQEGAKKKEAALLDNNDNNDALGHIRTISKSGSQKSSTRRSASRSFSSSRHSISVSFSLVGPVNIQEITEAVDSDDYEEHIKTDKTNEDGEKHKKVPMTRLAYLNKPEALILFLGTLAASVHGVVFPMIGFMLSTVLKSFYEPPELLRKDSRKWAILYMCLAVVCILLIPFQNFLFGVAGGKLIRRIRYLCFEKIVHQEGKWFDDPGNSSGAIGARLSIDAANVRSLVGDQLALVMQNIASLAAGLVIALTSNWMLALIIIAVGPLFVVQGFLQGKFMKGFSADAKLVYEEASQVANDAVGSIRTVASFCSEEKVMDLYNKKCEGPVKNGVRLGLISGLGFGFSFLALNCTNAFCFFIGALLIQHGKATFGDVFKVFFAVQVSAIGLSQSSSMALDRAKANASAVSIFKILDSKPSIDSKSDEGITLESVRGDIEFSHVRFHYPTRPDVQIFRDLSLFIPSKKTVALVGESGSGKSTVVSLIERFYSPDKGRVLLDGIELQKFKLSWLRQQMGLVGQEPILFNDTIRSNIAYGKQTSNPPTEAEIISASKSANADNFISSLPQGYDTNVGERGVQLSGGQKQRIAIARAILKNPRILLLDEATSALDSESEKIVQDALDTVRVDRTTVVVAHRLSTIVNADVIGVVKNGVIAEKGRHDELMKIEGGVYASLVALHASACD